MAKFFKKATSRSIEENSTILPAKGLRIRGPLAKFFAMLKENLDIIQSKLKPGSKMLDIGGWASPLHRANYVMDMAPYETHIRNSDKHNPHHRMDMPEQFSADTWIVRDICAREPYPFKDKELDFVVCSHTLEDIRDPIWVCSEMARISKAGYIEVPSRLVETCRGVNRDCPVGYYHHRWMVEVEGKAVRFTQKTGIIFNHWSYSFPRKYLWSLSPDQRVTYLFWEGTFEATEVSSHDKEEIKKELAGYVAKHHPYPAWRFQAEETMASLNRGRRAIKKVFKRKRS